MSEDTYGTLASLVNTAMISHTKQALSGVGPVLATLTPSGLKLDDFKHEIQDFLVAELPGNLVLPEFTLAGTVEGLRDGSGGMVGGEGRFLFHEAEIEKTLLNVRQGLRPGDRVLALRLNGGQDVIVMCKVVSGNA
ncbi:hypothetical protein EJP77_04955 [Paenibacillus zeisoli]|uniref:DUF2577 domain-containing protein n=1 Tax=Paenibacillus zeisoli TaxID=2496267 RepID=A0A433XQL2_9BACL|nr:hypothetical protein [Paenibacillus zeisoli]RUT36336.1 hypothetical protein EJP77_04955 [Paenibacillus zeisoli]